MNIRQIYDNVGAWLWEILKTVVIIASMTPPLSHKAWDVVEWRLNTDGGWQAAEGAAVPDVFLLILLCDLDVSSIWFQLVGGDLPQDLLVNREEHLKTTFFYVIIPVGQRIIIITNTSSTTMLVHRGWWIQKATRLWSVSIKTRNYQGIYINL